MAKNLGCIKLLLGIGIVLFLVWFLIFSIVPERTLPALGFFDNQGFILRLYGIFQLSWAVLFLFALKNVEKNMAIINTAIITGALVFVSIVAFCLVKAKTGWFFVLSAAAVLVYAVLLFICKPKASP